MSIHFLPFLLPDRFQKTITVQCTKLPLSAAVMWLDSRSLQFYSLTP